MPAFLVRLARPAALTTGFLAGLLLLASGLGARAGFWHWRTGFEMLGCAVWVGIAGALLALGSLAWPAGRRGGRWRLAVGALAVALAAIIVPWQFRQQARAVPPIHDLSTDLADPPAFQAVLALRKAAGATNPPEHPGAEVAEQQKKAYPELQPLVLQAPPAVAFARARDAAESLGWKIALADVASGRIEATATTFWFGFQDDVVVRIRADGTGSRIDVRSKSRVGRSDVGANARRIREYLARLRA